jgi:hypothetical protein
MVDLNPADAIVLLVVGAILIQGMWLSFLTYNMYREHKTERHQRLAREEEEREKERSTFVDDIFLLHRSGLLLKHYTRRLRPNMDSDVLSGMLVAVQEFMKDSFREVRGNVNEIQLGELRIILVEGRWIVVAAVVRGERPVDLKPQIEAALRDIEAQHEDLLMDWDGTMDRVSDVDDIMHDLIDGRYRDRVAEKTPG